MKAPLVFSPYAFSDQDRVYRNVLPHRYRSGKTVFVTWRLSDSLPAEADLLQSIRNAQKRWLRNQGLLYCPWSQDIGWILKQKHPDKLWNFLRITFLVKERLDHQKNGSCCLRDPRAISVVRQAIDKEETRGV